MSYPFKPFMAKLDFSGLVKHLRAVFSKLPDFRKGAPQTIYTMEDAAVSAFSVFFRQSPSFLAWEREKQEQKGRNNIQSLFQVEKIPSDNWNRKLLDRIQRSFSSFFIRFRGFKRNRSFV